MSDENTGNGVPTSFWIYGGAALVWNLIGLWSFINSISNPATGNPAFTEAQQAFFAGTPSWVTGAFAVAVIAGTLGSVFLLLRKNWAYPTFVVSIIGVIAQNSYAFGVAGALEVFGGQALVLPSIVFVVGVLLIFYSRAVRAKSWYR